MAKEKYASAYNIAKKLTEQVKVNRSLAKASDAFYFVALKYYLGLSEDEIHDSITDLSYVLGNSVNGQLKDNGIDAIYINRNENTVYIFNFKYLNSLKSGNFPSNECDKILAYLDILFSFDENREYYFNDKLKEKTKQVVNYMDENIVTIKVVLASNHFEGLEDSKKEIFENALNDRNQNITFEEFHLSELMDKYLNREHKSYIGVCAVDKESMFPKKSNLDVSLFVVKIRALDLLKLFVDNKSQREKKQSLSPAEIIACQIEESLFDDNVRIFLTKSNKVNKKIVETAKNQAQDFFFYNNGVTILCDKCTILAGQPNKLQLLNYQVVNGGQTIHAIYEAAKSDYNCLEQVEILCRIFAGTDEDKKSKVARYTNTQTPVTERDLSSLDYIQMLLNEEFHLHGLYYERKEKQYKSFAPTKLRYDSYKTGQLLLSFKLGKPHIARANKKEIFTDTYVDKIFDTTVTAEEIIKLYNLENWLKPTTLMQKNYCKNAKLYVVYFYKIVFEKYRTPQNGKMPEVLDIDFKNVNTDAFAKRCYDITFKVLQYIVDKKKKAVGVLFYDDSNYFKTEHPIKDFIEAIETFGPTLNEIESADFTVVMEPTETTL